MAETLPVGVISIGSNDIHLLVATSDGHATFERLVNTSVLARLADTVEGDVIPPKALGEALQDLEDLVTAAKHAGATPILAIATEALREVSNGTAFVELVAATLKITTLLISGQEEAALDYCWATFPHLPSSPTLIVDSGGGSTQVVWSSDPGPVFATSLPVGAGNMTKRFISNDPPTREEMRALADEIASFVGTLPTELSVQGAILMGGSADHLCQFSPHPKMLTLKQDHLHQALHELQKKSARQVADDYDIPIERVRLLPAGAIILEHILSRYGIQEAQVKPNGIRGGLVVSYARYGSDWRHSFPLPSTWKSNR
jgi:exopolyphosphatase/guanosine-5'-triphosphate,3'-diphosphate pyrophosphatase